MIYFFVILFLDFPLLQHQPKLQSHRSQCVSTGDIPNRHQFPIILPWWTMVSAPHNPFPFIHLVNNQQSQSLDTSVVTQRRCLSGSVHSNIQLHNIAAICKEPNFPKRNLSKIVKYQRYFEDHRTKNNNNIPLPVLYVYIIDEEKEGHFVYCQLLILNKP